jgi:site-specific DNA-methyltransferase (adenine-specific)
LVCGDSRDDAAWNLLMGDERAQMVWTDPPYGVSYVGKTAESLTINNDSLSEVQLLEFLRQAFKACAERCRPGSAWYVASPAGPLFGAFGIALKEIDAWRHTLVWVKQQFVLGRADYHYRHEPIFYGWLPGASHYFIEDRTQDSVLEFDRPHRSSDHPTMKPVALVRKCIENSSMPGWIVVDPFGGSGTTLAACVEAGRVARLIELDPRYCDVIRRRWGTLAISAGIDPGPDAILPG